MSTIQQHDHRSTMASTRAALVVALATIAATGARAQVAPIDFDASPAVTVPGPSHSTRLADLDGDGRLEACVWAPWSGLYVFADDGAGWLSAFWHVPLTVGTTYEPVVADFDGDGDLDVLVGSTLGGQHSLLVNPGDGRLVSAPFTLSFGTQDLRQVLAGDLDGDGDVDLVGLTISTTQGVALNDGTGVFTPSSTFTSGLTHMSGVLADMDGDLDLDVLVAANRIAVFKNDGAGAFGAATVLVTSTPLNDVRALDLDADGDLDACAVSFNAMWPLLNDGSGTFTFGTTLSIAPGVATRIESADLDADGDLDLALWSDTSNAIVRIVDNLGGATFGTPRVLQTGPSTGNVEFGDLDQDGDLDVAVTSNSGQMSAYFNDGTGAFATKPLVALGNQPSRFGVADIDGDGHVDLATTLQSTGGIAILHGDGNGGFSATVNVPAGPLPTSLALGDVTADGRVDVWVASSFHDVIHLLVQQPDGSFVPSPFVPSGGDSPGGLALGDLDGDFDLDLVVANQFSDTIAVFFNQGGGTMSSPTTFGAGNGPFKVELRDMDLDGDLDLVHDRSEGGRISVCLNDGGGTFGAPATYVVGSFPAFTLGDVDGDGDLDVAVAASDDNQQAGLLTFLRNAGDGTLVANAPLPMVGTPGRDPMLVDVDLDADLDLLVNLRGEVVQVFANDGAGTFSSDRAFLPRRGGFRMAAADFDEDGDPDVATGANELEVWSNLAIAGTVVCAGDGSGAACPCGNESALGGGAGCTNSLGQAGALRASGGSSLAHDTLRLRATGLPEAPTLFFQGTSLAGSGAGVAFGDGLRCVQGAVVRLGIDFTSGGNAELGTSGTRLSVLGGVTAPGERLYQAWYRNSASFCTPAGFNLTNAVRLTWSL